MYPKFKKPSVPMHPMGMDVEHVEKPHISRHGHYGGLVAGFEHTVGGFNKKYGTRAKPHKRF